MTAGANELPSWNRRGGRDLKKNAAKQPLKGADGVVGRGRLRVSDHPGASRRPSCTRRGASWFTTSLTTLAVLIAFFALRASAQSTQLDVSGAWAVTLEAPRGDVDFRMWVVQKGSKLTGYMLSEVGQFDMEGSITGNQIKFSWNFPDGGQMVPISCQGKVEGNFITGTAKVGNLGEGPMNAERR